MLSAEAQAKMLMWRQKCIDRTISEEEVREAMALLREQRSTAATATAKAKVAKAKAVIPTADDLLKELGEDFS